MLGVAVGQIGLSIEEFWSLTFSEFLSIWGSWFNSQKSRADLITELRKDIYEQMRWQTAFILTALGGKEIDPRELFPLTGDQPKPKPKPITKERIQQLKKAWLNG